jgi:exonuclease SbcD
MTIADIDSRLQENLAAILADLAEEADQYDMPRILTGHFTISGAVLGSERGIMLGRDVMAGLSSVADSCWDYVAMGHIHKHQNLTAQRTDTPPVVYSGSMERIDFGEEGDPKGFCWAEIERGAAKYEFVRLDARPFVTLRADLRESGNPTKEVMDLIAKHKLEGAVVRLMVDVTPENEAGLSEVAIRDALRRAEVYHIAGMRKEVDQADRARLGANPEGMTPEQLLERYLLSREIPQARREELIEAAQAIFEAQDQLGAQDSYL